MLDVKIESDRNETKCRGVQSNSVTVPEADGAKPNLNFFGKDLKMECR